MFVVIVSLVDININTLKTSNLSYRHARNGCDFEGNSNWFWRRILFDNKMFKTTIILL